MKLLERLFWWVHPLDSQVDGHRRSKLNHTNTRIAWELWETHDRGADIAFYEVKVFEHKDTGETVYSEPNNRSVWGLKTEFRKDVPDSTEDTVRYKDDMMVLPQEAKHVSKYR